MANYDFILGFILLDYWNVQGGEIIKIISFAWTSDVVKSEKKDMTRRFWKNSHARKFKKGDIVAAYDKIPIQGGKCIKIVRLTKDPYKQKLSDMPEGDVKREGGLWKDKKEFVEMMGGEELSPWVIEFEYCKENCKV